ncbi:hypothetical protein [Tepidimicrobium xylanilyticum]
MNYNRWLQDTAILKKGEKKDTFGKTIFEEEKPIQVKIEEKMKLIRTATGEEIIATAVVYTSKEEDIKVGDYIGNNKVVYTTLMKDFKNRPLLREVWVK